MENPHDQNGPVYRFDDVVIDCDNFELRKTGEIRTLTPRAFDVLIYLIENRGRVAEKQELFEQVWKGAFVTDNSLTRAVKELRRELGDRAGEQLYIETVHKRGYRFIAELKGTADKEGDFKARTGLSESSDTSKHEPMGGYGKPTAPEISERTHSPLVWVTEHKTGVALVLATTLLVLVLTVYFRQSESAIRSIAVLPLENATADADMEYMSDGITESLINSLSELPGLKVIARTTAFRYRDREFDPQKLRRDLGVDAVLTGRVVKQGDDLIVQADLIDATDGSQIWGKRYSRKLSEISALQGEIATDMSKKLRLKVTGEQEKRITKQYTENTEAYQLYLMGRYFWNKRTPDGLNKSIGYFQQAIEKDPNYALAYSGLADTYAVMAINADVSPHEVYPKAKAAAMKALELDDTLVEAHATMLQIRSQYDWDWPGVEQEYRRAIELNPNYPMTHVYYMSYLLAAGRQDEALASIKRAQELDPLSLIINSAVARALFFAHRYDEAIEASQKTLELDENFFVARLFLGRSYKEKGMYEQAIAELSRARELSGGISETASLLGYVYAISGKRAEAMKVLVEITELSKQRYVPPYNLAMVYAGLGDKDRAFEWLEKAYEDRNQQLTLINAAPEFESLRSDHRFSRLLHRMQAGQ